MNGQVPEYVLAERQLRGKIALISAAVFVICILLWIAIVGVGPGVFPTPTPLP